MSIEINDNPDMDLSNINSLINSPNTILMVPSEIHKISHR